MYYAKKIIPILILTIFYSCSSSKPKTTVQVSSKSKKKNISSSKIKKTISSPSQKADTQKKDELKNWQKVDFDKLDRKYNQLTLNVEDKKNKAFENLQRINEELSMSLQKQKIVAYDAISGKSDIERKLKIAQSETTELNSQMKDFNNIANANGVLKNDLSQARSQIKSLNNDISKRYKPNIYPTRPPSTEKNVVLTANLIQLYFFVSAIGANKTSGGIGKNELSINDTRPK